MSIKEYVANVIEKAKECLSDLEFKFDMAVMNTLGRYQATYQLAEVITSRPDTQSNNSGRNATYLGMAAFLSPVPAIVEAAPAQQAPISQQDLVSILAGRSQQSEQPEAKIDEFCKQYNSQIPKQLFEIYSKMTMDKTEAVENTGYALRYLDGMNDQIQDKIVLDNKLSIHNKIFLVNFIRLMPKNPQEWIQRFEHMNYYVESEKSKNIFEERTYLRKQALETGQIVSKADLEQLLVGKKLIIIGFTKEEYLPLAALIGEIKQDVTYFVPCDFAEQETIDDYISGKIFEIPENQINGFYTSYPELLTLIKEEGSKNKIKSPRVIISNATDEIVTNGIYYDLDDIFPFDSILVKDVMNHYGKAKVVIMPLNHLKPLTELFKKEFDESEIFTILTLKPDNILLPGYEHSNVKSTEKNYDLFILPEKRNRIIKLETKK